MLQIEDTDLNGMCILYNIKFYTLSNFLGTLCYSIWVTHKVGWYKPKLNSLDNF